MFQQGGSTPPLKSVFQEKRWSLLYPPSHSWFSIFQSSKLFTIHTCFGVIRIEKNFDENSSYLASLSVYEALINRSKATFSGPFFSGYSSQIWQGISSPNSSDHEIRKINNQDLKLMSNQEVKGAIGTQQVIVSDRHPSKYVMNKIEGTLLAPLDPRRVSSSSLSTIERCEALSAACFVYKNQGDLPLWEKYYRICYIIECFWGPGTSNNVIVSLLEKGGELKSLDNINTFLVDEVIGMYKAGKSKEEILQAIDLPFVKQEHPMFRLLTRCCKVFPRLPETGKLELYRAEHLFSEYESGKSNGEILRLFEQFYHLADPDSTRLRTPFINGGSGSNAVTSLYFFGQEGEVFMSKILKRGSFFSEKKESLFWDELRCRLDAGESREAILKDLRLPLPPHIYHLVEQRVREKFPSTEESLIASVFDENFDLFFFSKEDKEFKALALTIKESLIAFFSNSC